MSLFGIHALSVSPEGGWAGVERAVDRLAEAGIRALEVPLGAPGRNAPQRLADFAARNAFTLLPSLALPPALDIRDDLQDALDFLEGIFRDCSAIGATELGGRLFGADATPPADLQRAEDALARFFDRAARLARGFKLSLRVDPAGRFETSLLNRAADAAALIERVGAENLTVGLDSFAMQSEEASFLSAFETAEPFLRFVRISESHRGLPGTGMLDWHSLLEPLATMNFRGPLVLYAAPALRAEPLRFEALMEEGVPFLRERAAAARFTLG